MSSTGSIRTASAHHRRTDPDEAGGDAVREATGPRVVDSDAVDDTIGLVSVCGLPGFFYCTVWTV